MQGRVFFIGGYAMRKKIGVSMLTFIGITMVVNSINI